MIFQTGSKTNNLEQELRLLREMSITVEIRLTQEVRRTDPNHPDLEQAKQAIRLVHTLVLQLDECKPKHSADFSLLWLLGLIVSTAERSSRQRVDA